jgi:predicted nucleotidyltransferase
VDKNDIEKYLRMVGHELHEKGLTLDILLLGGAAMLIEVGNRESTQDIDTFFWSDFGAIAKAAAAVAEREGLQDGWLNNAAAGFTHNFIKQPSGKLWRQFPGLRIYTPSLEYLLVTKVMAGRPRDDGDIRALAQMLGVSERKDVLDLVLQYVPKEDVALDVLRGIERCFRS